MSRPKFMVFKLSDLKIPFIMLLVVIAAFSFFMLTNNDSEQTFAPDNSYKDGIYIANLAFTDANLDVIVNVAKNQIASVTLDGFDENEKMLYQGLSDSISFVNDYVTSTQSLELPADSTITASTSILMDAISVALSDDQNATLNTTYEVPLLEELTNQSSTLPAEENATASVESTDSVKSAEETLEVNSDLSAVSKEPQN